MSANSSSLAWFALSIPLPDLSICSRRYYQYVHFSKVQGTRKIDGTLHCRTGLEWSGLKITSSSTQKKRVLFWDQVTQWFIIACLLCIFNSDPRGQLSLNHRAQHNVAIMLLTFFVGELRLKGRVKETSPWQNSGWAAGLCGRVLNEQKPDSLRVNSLPCAAARRLVALHLPGCSALTKDEWLLGEALLFSWNPC